MDTKALASTFGDYYLDQFNRGDLKDPKSTSKVLNFNLSGGSSNVNQGSQEKGDAVSLVLDTLPFGVIQLNEELSVVTSNTTARTIVEKVSYLSFRNNTLKIDHPSLRRAIFRVRSGDSEAHVQIQSAPGESFSFVISRSDVNGTSASIVVTVRNSWEDFLFNCNFLKRRYALTDAESEIVKLLAEGYHVKQIAKLRNTSVSTVRSQMKTVYFKTQSSGQLDLIRTIIFGKMT